MAKGAVGLVAGFWPEDIYRYLAVPGLSLDEAVVTRPARRRADQTALVEGDCSLSYRQWSQDVERTAGLLRARLGGDNRVAVVVRGQVESLKLVLGALRARCVVAMLDPRVPGAQVLEQLAAFQPKLVIAEPDLVKADTAQAEKGTLSPTEFWQGEPGRASVAGRLDLKAPAVALSGMEGRLVYHSHASLVAWAVSWSAFVPISEESVVLSLEPATRWGGLTAALPALFRGARCVFAPCKVGLVVEAVRAHRPGYLLLSWRDAITLTAEDGVTLRRALRDSVEGMFVVVERPFSVRERWRLEAALDLPVLTVLGNAATGPALASHPQWYLQEAVGIPVTNVDVWPLHPRTHIPFAVPWEAIELGEVGVRSPMCASEFHTAEDRDEWVRDQWLRLGVVAAMDPTGLYHLRS